jgi:hypothetical protein
MDARDTVMARVIRPLESLCTNGRQSFTVKEVLVILIVLFAMIGGGAARAAVRLRRRGNARSMSIDASQSCRRKDNCAFQSWLPARAF